MEKSVQIIHDKRNVGGTKRARSKINRRKLRKSRGDETMVDEIRTNSSIQKIFVNL